MYRTPNNKKSKHASGDIRIPTLKIPLILIFDLIVELTELLVRWANRLPRFRKSFPPGFSLHKVWILPFWFRFNMYQTKTAVDINYLHTSLKFETILRLLSVDAIHFKDWKVMSSDYSLNILLWLQ